MKVMLFDYIKSRQLIFLIFTCSLSFHLRGQNLQPYFQLRNVEYQTLVAKGVLNYQVIDQNLRNNFIYQLGLNFYLNEENYLSLGGSNFRNPYGYEEIDDMLLKKVSYNPKNYNFLLGFGNVQKINRLEFYSFANIEYTLRTNLISTTRNTYLDSSFSFIEWEQFEADGPNEHILAFSVGEGVYYKFWKNLSFGIDLNLQLNYMFSKGDFKNTHYVKGFNNPIATETVNSYSVKTNDILFGLRPFFGIKYRFQNKSLIKK